MPSEKILFWNNRVQLIEFIPQGSVARYHPITSHHPVDKPDFLDKAAASLRRYRCERAENQRARQPWTPNSYREAPSQTSRSERISEAWKPAPPLNNRPQGRRHRRGISEMEYRAAHRAAILAQDGDGQRFTTLQPQKKSPPGATLIRAKSATQEYGGAAVARCASLDGNATAVCSCSHQPSEPERMAMISTTHLAMLQGRPPCSPAVSRREHRYPQSRTLNTGIQPRASVS